MTEPVVCIFPHSDDEFSTPDKLRNFLSDELPAEPEPGRYLLRKIRRRDKDFKVRVTRGSLVLFSKKGQIVGQATAQNAIRELEPPEPGETEMGISTIYYHEIFFDPMSIKVYSEALPIEELESWSGRRLYPGTYAVLGTRRAYERHFGER